jgi:hypothetical protein
MTWKINLKYEDELMMKYSENLHIYGLWSLNIILLKKIIMKEKID